MTCATCMARSTGHPLRQPMVHTLLRCGELAQDLAELVTS